MIHLHTSKIFTDDLKKAGCSLSQTGDELADWHWHAHCTTLMRKKCIIVMEEASRYALIFVGLKKSDFANFDQVLISRIIAETSCLCDLPHPDQNEKLIDAVAQKCSTVVFSQGLERSVQAHIRQVADDVDYLIKEQLGFLPDSAEDEFSLGARINNTPRKCGKDKDYFYPPERLHRFLMALIATKLNAKVINLDDFRRGR